MTTIMTAEVAAYLDDLLTCEQVCAELGCSARTLREWISKKRFPEPLRIGKRCSRWRRSDVEQFKRRRADRRTGTSNKNAGRVHYYPTGTKRGTAKMITQSSVPFISDAAGPGQILKAPSRAPPRIVTTDPNGPAPGNEHLGDLGNAVAFARHHADHLRYCWPWKKWLYWTGRKWTTDESGHVYQLAKDVIRAMYQAAVDESDDATRKAKVKHVLATESRKAHIDAMIDLARSELVIQPDQLDNYMMHLNVGNGLLALGILDKPTDVFLPHNQYEIFCRDEFCMAIAPVWYKPAAACPTWLKFLDTIFSGNVRVINFVQELAGYALTGDVREQVLPIFYGSGANGKSTFVNTLLAILGEDYAIPGPRPAHGPQGRLPPHQRRSPVPQASGGVAGNHGRQPPRRSFR